MSVDLTQALNIVITIVSGIIPIISGQYFLTIRRSLLKRCTEIRENLFRIVDIDVKKKLVESSKPTKTKSEIKEPKTLEKALTTIIDIRGGTFKELQRRRAQLLSYCNIYDAIEEATLDYFYEIDKIARNAFISSFITVLMILLYIFSPSMMPELQVPSALYAVIAFLASIYYFTKFIYAYVDLTDRLNFLENITDLEELRQYLEI